MTGFDVVLIVALVAFAILGLKHGSVWIVSCLVGGFFGAFLVEYYTLPVSELIGGFKGAQIISSALLFLVGVLVAIIPGWIISRIAGMFCLGALDKLLGVGVGLVAGLIAVTLAFMVLLPKFPSMEHSQSWRRSGLARPLCEHLQDFFGHPSKKRISVTEGIKDAISDKVTPIMNKTADTIKATTTDVENSVSKKTKAMKKAIKGAN